MAKRKFGASVIILCIAAITLISGTYAWFLVGGFANLFDIGFDVIEAKGSLLLQGDAGSARDSEGKKVTWGVKLEREDFKEYSFIVPGGHYKPVSSADANKFLMVGLENDVFTCDPKEAPNKASNAANPATETTQICYNNFTLRIKSAANDVVPGSVDGKYGAYIQIKLNGDSLKKKDDGTYERVKHEDNEDGAAVAARVSVTYEINDVMTTTIYSIDREDYRAVTEAFSGEILDAHTRNSGKTDTSGNIIYEGDRIITESDTNYTTANLTKPTNYQSLRETVGTDNKVPVKIYLGEIPNNASDGKEITIKVWLEGNDKDCVDFANDTVAGKSLMSDISFGIDEQ